MSFFLYSCQTWILGSGLGIFCGLFLFVRAFAKIGKQGVFLKNKLLKRVTNALEN